MTPATIIRKRLQTVSARIGSGRATLVSRWLPERSLPLLILLPTLIVTAVFVYGFIFYTFHVSLSNWRTLSVDLSLRQPLLITYSEMFALPRFQSGIRNTLVFTTLFLVAAVGSGLLLALILDQKLIGCSFFRNIFLFPYALSFIVTGVAWRWIFNPESGVNVLFELAGVNRVLATVGVGPLQPGWLTDPSVVLAVNDALAYLFPHSDFIRIKLGIPLAIIPVVIAATWQLSGFAMAIYLAGLGTIQREVREAALIDGANSWQATRYVVIPLLRPFTVIALIILGHTSLKIFDLIYAMSGTGPGFATDVVGIFVFETTFKAGRFNLGAAASMVMLLMVCVVIVPYLARSMKEE
jgi:glucose/mannose transport system permease protein